MATTMSNKINTNCSNCAQSNNQHNHRTKNSTTSLSTNNHNHSFNKHQHNQPSSSSQTTTSTHAANVAAAVAMNIAKLFTNAASVANISKYTQQLQQQQQQQDQHHAKMAKTNQDETESIVSLSSSSSSIKSVHSSDEYTNDNVNMPTCSKYEAKQELVTEEFLVNDDDDDDDIKSNSSSSNSVHLIVDETSINIEPNTNLVELDSTSNSMTNDQIILPTTTSTSSILNNKPNADELAAKIIKEFSASCSTDPPTTLTTNLVCSDENNGSMKIMNMDQDDTQITNSSLILVKGKPSMVSTRWRLVLANSNSDEKKNYIINLDETNLCVRVGDFVRFKLIVSDKLATNVTLTTTPQKYHQENMDDSSNANYSMDDNNETSSIVNYEHFIGKVVNIFKSEDGK